MANRNWLLAFALAFFATVLHFSYSTAIAAEATPILHRDWKQYPAIADLPAPATVYALGDVHGDCDKMLELLAAAKLIAAIPAKPVEARWAGGNADLVLLGDMIDKYDHSLAVLQTLRALEPQAEKAGGHLVVCLGNHEAEFLAAGGENKKGAEFEQEMKAAGISARDVAQGRDGLGLGAWLRTRPVGARIGEWFFCHAGNTGGLTLVRLESDLKKELTEKGYAAPILAGPDSMLEARMHPRPWWTGVADPSLHESKKQRRESRSDSGREAPAPARLLANVSALGAKHLIIAHQPGRIKFEDGSERTEGAMFARYDGLFFMIDTGMSRGVSNGRSSLLQIQGSENHVTATAVYADGKTSLLWKE